MMTLAGAGVGILPSQQCVAGRGVRVPQLKINLVVVNGLYDYYFIAVVYLLGIERRDVSERPRRRRAEDCPSRGAEPPANSQMRVDGVDGCTRAPEVVPCTKVRDYSAPGPRVYTKRAELS